MTPLLIYLAFALLAVPFLRWLDDRTMKAWWYILCGICWLPIAVLFLLMWLSPFAEKHSRLGGRNQ